MSDNNTPETILIRESTLLPAGLAVESEVFSPGWRVVKNLDLSTLARNIEGANWTFFCMGREIRTTVFGIDEEKMILRAIKEIFGKTQVGEIQFLGNHPSGLGDLEAFLGHSLYNCFRPIKAHPKSPCLVPAKDFVSRMLAARRESGRGRGGEQDHADAATKVHTALISSS